MIFIHQEWQNLNPRNYNKQALKPFSSSFASKFFPMKTSLFTLGSSEPHGLSGEPWNISCTPCRGNIIAKKLEIQQKNSMSV